jgi:hypothetical protein
MSCWLFCTLIFCTLIHYRTLWIGCKHFHSKQWRPMLIFSTGEDGVYSSILEPLPRRSNCRMCLCFFKLNPARTKCPESSMKSQALQHAFTQATCQTPCKMKLCLAVSQPPFSRVYITILPQGLVLDSKPKLLRLWSKATMLSTPEREALSNDTAKHPGSWPSKSGPFSYVCPPMWCASKLCLGRSHSFPHNIAMEGHLSQSLDHKSKIL